MTKAHFTAEQIADFLQQSKNDVSSEILCERYGFSVGTLRRWQKQHAEGIRRELKQSESTGAVVFLFFFTSAISPAIMLSKSLSACVMFFLPAYCVGYIHQLHKILTKHIQEKNVFLARSERGARNAFYHFS